MKCPKCQYERKSTDTAPDWQCPACGVAYAKAGQVNQRLGKKTKLDYHSTYGAKSLRDHVLTGLVLASLCLFAVSWWQKGVLPTHKEIEPALMNSPIQSKTSRKPFQFHYRGEDYLIKPKAEYEIWGLVVTHNNITGITDVMHTSDSVDLKDLCVIWGANLVEDDFRKVSYSSGDFICYFQYPSGVYFAHNKLSNNHLLSDRESVRELIRNARVGDQIYFKGMLVDYSPKSNPRWVRRTSLNRNDTGNGACEVVFVEDFKIIKQGNPAWHLLYTITLWLTILLAAVKLYTAIFPAKR